MWPGPTWKRQNEEFFLRQRGAMAPRRSFLAPQGGPAPAPCLWCGSALLRLFCPPESHEKGPEMALARRLHHHHHRTCPVAPAL